MTPWRLLFPHAGDLLAEQAERLFAAIEALERKRQTQGIPWGEEEDWSANQTSGEFVVRFDDRGIVVHAEMQIIGTFNEGTFLWAWANPSIREELSRDAVAVHDLLRQEGWSVLNAPKFPATTRDACAVLALAAELTNAEGAYIANTGSALVLMTLRNLRQQKRGPSEVEQPSAETPPFRTLEAMINAQVASVQLPLEELRKVEMVCRRGHEQVEGGQSQEAVRTFDEAWQMLGQYASDQEPAGWIQLARGNALYLAGDYDRAIETLTEAERTFGCPDRALLYRRLGQCYFVTSDEPRAIDTLVRCYVAEGVEGLGDLTDDQVERLLTVLRERKQQARARVDAALTPGEDQRLQRAAAIVTCLIQDLHASEVEAHALSEAAAKQRTQRHVTCAADEEAHEKINTTWCWLLATWFTPGQKPTRGSWGSPPEHDPAQEKVVSVHRAEDGLILVDTQAKTAWGEQRWRYTLTEQADGLLVTSVEAIWDEEEFEG